MKKYGCVIVRYGYAEVEAESAAEAMDIVNQDYTTDDVNWSDDWAATDAEEVEE